MHSKKEGILAEIVLPLPTAGFRHAPETPPIVRTAVRSEEPMVKPKKLLPSVRWYKFATEWHNPREEEEEDKQQLIVYHQEENRPCFVPVWRTELVKMNVKMNSTVRARHTVKRGGIVGPGKAKVCPNKANTTWRQQSDTNWDVRLYSSCYILKCSVWFYQSGNEARKKLDYNVNNQVK